MKMKEKIKYTHEQQTNFDGFWLLFPCLRTDFDFRKCSKIFRFVKFYFWSFLYRSVYYFYLSVFQIQFVVFFFFSRSVLLSRVTVLSFRVHLQLSSLRINLFI